MPDDESESDGSVSIQVELAGEYDEVIGKLQADTSELDLYEDMIRDFEILLEVLKRENGGTRSALAEAVERSGSEPAATLDSEQIVTYLRVLKAYDLVELEGNTWKPGPRLETY